MDKIQISKKIKPTITYSTYKKGQLFKNTAFSPMGGLSAHTRKKKTFQKHPTAFSPLGGA